MNFHLITSYPLWFFIFCILLGAAYALALYYKEKKNEFSKPLKRIMGFFRFILVTIIAFLLLSPYVKTETHLTEKPVIVLAQDNSESIVHNKDSAYYKTEYKKKLRNLQEALQSGYNLKTYAFSTGLNDTIPFSYNGKQTDIYNLFNEIENKYINRNLGAIILSTDGIYNKGRNPLYSLDKIKAPVYCIALGDTTARKDLLIKEVKHNPIAYLDNYFPLEIITNARKLEGQSFTVSVKSDNEELFKKTVRINSEDDLLKIPVQLEANEPGIKKYTVAVSRLDGEVSYANNVQNVYIDILDTRQKILILAGAPHPDVSAIKSAIEKNKNYKVERYLMDDFTEPVNKYNLVILNQLPTRQHRLISMMNKLRENKIPSLFIIGSDTYIPYFNSLNAGLKIHSNRNAFNDSKAYYNKKFTLFTLSEKAAGQITGFPPLSCPFGKYSNTTSSDVLFYQEIGKVRSTHPLILFDKQASQKTGFVTGEGLWRWKLADYKINEDHEIFNEIIGKMVQYLGIQVDKSLFRVECQNDFSENENIEFKATLYNESYELINEPNVSLTIYNEEGEQYPFTFSKTSNAYYLNAGSFPPGNFRYIARVKIGNEQFVKNGNFTVKSINLESINTIADHHLLYKITEKTGGELIFPQNSGQIIEKLKNREDIVTVSYTKKSLEEIIHLPWLLGLILFLLAAEWFLRKWGGGY